MKKKILFFIKGACPTQAEREASEGIEGVVFRNANFAVGEPPETCDGVAGCVPENYKRFGIVGKTENKSKDKTKIEPKDKPKDKTEAKSKGNSKPKIEHERDGSQPGDGEEPAQAPLIPAESEWKPNS